MGGQNHQPTRTSLTAASAWLSQRVGEGFTQVLDANGHLESAIMLGMNRRYVEDLASGLEGEAVQYVDMAVSALQASLRTLEAIDLGFARLLQSANAEGYRGNPFAAKLDELRLKPAFAQILLMPSVNEGVWDDLERRIAGENILSTLAWEARQFGLLEAPTRDLVQTLQRCRGIAGSEGGPAMALAIENNEIPLRQHYARVFSLWNGLHAMFLYSALIMTELFYLVNGFPGLLEFEPMTRRAQAA